MRVIVLSLILGVILGASGAALWLPRGEAPGMQAGAAAGISSPASQPSPAAPAGRGRLSEIVALASVVEQHAALYAMVRAADETRVLDLLEQASGIAHAEAAWILAVLYARYAEIDGDAALEHLRGAPRYANDQRMLAGLFVAWVRVDEASAVRALRTLGVRDRTAVAMFALQGGLPLSERQRQSLASAAGLGRYWPELQGVAPGFRLDDDPGTQFDALLASDDYFRRQVSLNALMAQWARQDPRAAMSATDRVSSLQLRTQLRHQVLSEWAQVDAEAALEWAISAPEPQQRDQFSLMVLQQAAVHEPRGAMALIARLAPDQRRSALTTVLNIWGQMEPVGAAEWLYGVGDASIRDAVINPIAQGLARQDPTRALQWLDTLPASDKARAAEGLAVGLAETDPQAAAAVLGFIDDPARRANALYGVTTAWARHDPRRAAAWIEQDVAADQRADLLPLVVEQWAQYDAQAALEYADALEVPAQRESAIVAVLPNLSLDPQLAETYFATLTRPEWRQRAARMLYGLWRHTDPQRAEAYRAVAGIEEDMALPGTPRPLGAMGTQRAVGILRNRSLVDAPP